MSRFSMRRVGFLLACALVAAAVPAGSAHAVQITPATATYRVSLEGSYTATATAPYSSCERWVGPPGPDGGGREFFTVTASATESASFHSTKPATVSWAGPYGSLPLSPEGTPRLGRVSLSLQRSSNMHANDVVDGCNIGDTPESPPPPVASDCGSRLATPSLYAGNEKRARSNRSRASIVAGFVFNPQYQACTVPAGIDFGGLQDKAALAALRSTRPQVSRLFTGSRRIVEQGSATVHSVGSDQGSAATYTLTLKVTLTRTKLQRARFR